MAPRKKLTEAEAPETAAGTATAAEPETETAEATAAEPETEPVPEPEAEPVPDPEPEPGAESEAEPGPEPEPEPEPPEDAAGTGGQQGARHDENILTLNDLERGFTRDAGEDVKWRYLQTAMHRRIVLTGVVSGVEYLQTPDPVCVIDCEGVRVCIPGHEMFIGDWPKGEIPPLEFRLRLSRILGATVDFIVAGVDAKNRAAVASRRAALLEAQKRYYGGGRVREGILVACRVVGVRKRSLTVEALGVETDVSAADASWEWFPEMGDLYSAGDLVVARVMSTEKDPETGTWDVRVSIREATENPGREAAKKLVENSSYFGVVTGVNDGMIFVRLQTGVNVKTPTYSTRTPPQKNDTVCFQVKAVTAAGAVYGLVTRVIRRNRLR